MKLEALQKVKFKKLQRRLKLPLWQVVGVLETLWQVTMNNAPLGDIGVVSDQDIADSLEWDGDADALITALIECNWIDRHPQHRLVIHDWHEHAPTFLKKRIGRAQQEFRSLPCDGGQRLPMADSGGQRRTVESLSEPMESLSEPMEFSGRLPSPTQPSPTQPNQAERGGGIQRLPTADSGGQRRTVESNSKNSLSLESGNIIELAFTALQAGNGKVNRQQFESAHALLLRDYGEQIAAETLRRVGYIQNGVKSLGTLRKIAEEVKSEWLMMPEQRESVGQLVQQSPLPSAMVEALRSKIGDEAFGDWFDEAWVEQLGPPLMIGIPSSYRLERIEQDYIDAIRGAAGCDVQLVLVTPSGNGVAQHG